MNLLRAVLISSLLMASAVAAQSRPTPVRVEAVRLEWIQERRLVVGEIRAAQRSLVAAEEPGRVTELLVREGMAVEAGAPLCRLDSTRLQLQQEILAAQEAESDTLLEQSRLEAEQADRDAATLLELSGRSAANPKELADANTAAQVARARVAQRERQLAQVRASRRLLQIRLEDLEIRAPYAGTVVTRHTDVGEWMSEGDPVLTLVSSELEGWLNVPQALFGPLAAHEVKLLVQVDATGETVELDQFRIIPDMDPSGRSFAVVASLPLGDGPARMAARMSLTAWVPTGKEAERLTLPVDAVMRNDVGTFVYVAQESEEGPPLAQPMLVEVAFEKGGRAVLRGDVPVAGSMVVVEGNERLLPMTPLAPQTSAGAAGSGGDGRNGPGEPDR